MNELTGPGSAWFFKSRFPVTESQPTFAYQEVVYEIARGLTRQSADTPRDTVKFAVIGSKHLPEATVISRAIRGKRVSLSTIDPSRLDEALTPQTYRFLLASFLPYQTAAEYIDRFHALTKALEDGGVLLLHGALRPPPGDVRVAARSPEALSVITQVVGQTNPSLDRFHMSAEQAEKCRVYLRRNASKQVSPLPLYPVFFPFNPDPTDEGDVSIARALLKSPTNLSQNVAWAIHILPISYWQDTSIHSHLMVERQTLDGQWHPDWQSRELLMVFQKLKPYPFEPPALPWNMPETGIEDIGELYTSVYEFAGSGQQPEFRENELEKKLSEATDYFFDVDNTLLFTQALYFQQKVRATLRLLSPQLTNHQSILSVVDIEKVTTATDVEKIAAQLFPQDPEIFFKVFNEQDVPDERMAETDIFPDAARLLTALACRGIRLYLVSHLRHGRLQQAAELIKEKVHKLIPNAPPIHFEDLVSPDSERLTNPSFKPDPEMFLHLIQLHGLITGKCAAIGDQISDVNASFAAAIGIPIYVSRQVKDTESTHGAYIVVTSLDEITSILESSNSR